MDTPTVRLNPNHPKILVVGAGGIGCEIIKSLAIDGSYEITVIDFDTISLSNLSRQFFYSEEDIGKEKSLTLAENAMKRYPQLTVTGISGNVLDDTFSPSFIKQFDFVFCGVDNIDARIRVSTLCVSTRTPFLDCASSGRSAQSVPTIPFKTACYVCSPVAAPSGPKVTCTIRSTPQSIEHCSAWAFHLFNAVFSGEGANDVIAVDNREPQAMFNNVFGKRIEELRAKTDLWKSREPPTPLSYEVKANHEPITRIMDKWSLEESVGVFADVLQRLQPPQTFDKDEEDHLAFTTAAANLQAAAFHIDKTVSMFENKGLVAVVVPALATTNSIISGIAVVQMKQVLSGQIPKAVWMSHTFLGPKLTPVSLDPTSKKCPMCSLELWEVDCDYSKTTVGNVGKQIGAESPIICYGSRIVFDEEDTDDRILSNCNIPDSVILIVEDNENTDFKATVILTNSKEERCEKIKNSTAVVEKPTYENDYSDVELIE